MSEINGDGYRIWIEQSTVHFDGTMRLSGPEAYTPIYELIVGAMTGAEKTALDLRDLLFLNSSGINLLAKATIEARKKPGMVFEVRGNASIPWQVKSLPNLKKLYPALELRMI